MGRAGPNAGKPSGAGAGAGWARWPWQPRHGTARNRGRRAVGLKPALACKLALRVLCAIPCLNEEVAIGSVVLQARRHPRHASGVLNDLLVAVGVQRPLLFLGVPGSLSLVAAIAAGTYTMLVFNRTGNFSLGWFMVTMFMALAGILGLFAGLLFNILPRIIQRSVRREA